MNGPPSQQESLVVEVFRAGDYGPKGVYTEETLDQIAADYDATRHEAPVTLDHETTGPAHGWVTGIRRLGDRLVASLSRLSPVLREALQSQGFKKRSIELYRKFSGTGRPYLKAVSFLGAAVPEVKGLADPSFAETVSFEEITSHPKGAEARQRLMDSGTWNPRWEEAGLVTLFDELAGTTSYESLLGILQKAHPPVVPQGRIAATMKDSITPFAEIPEGATTDSAERHLRVCQLLAEQPTLTYREALLALR